MRDETGKPLSGNIGITFTLYKDASDQVSVWQENQNVQLDSTGRYSVLLGATNEGGLPLEIFSAGDAHWLGVRPDGQAEQPRILLLSVAYALKAADTEMLGGKPASAYVLADSLASSAQPGAGAQVSSAGPQILIPPISGSGSLTQSPQASCSSVTSDGTATVNQIAKFTSACNIENSAIFESGGNVGIGNTSPAGTLDVSGTAFIRGALSLTPTGTATATQGFISNPLDFQASVFNTNLSKAVNYIFQWQAEPTGNDSANTGATLNLLYGVSGDITETGVSIAKNGIFTFASGQTFPGTGTGTVTSVGTGAGLTGGPITTSGTISIPSAGVTNAMLANPSLTVTAGTGLSGGGSVALGASTTVSLATALPNGETATTQSAGDNTTKVATDAFVLANVGTGTVTSVGTGAGLTGGPITKSGTISIPAAGVTNSMLANNSVTVAAGSGLSGGGTVALGGTVTLAGNLSGTTDGIAYFSSPASLISTPAPTNGQILIGSTGNAPVLGTLTAGSNISITNAPGSVTISAASGGVASLPFFVTAGERTGGNQSAGKNTTQLWGFLLPYNVTTTQITYDVFTADNTSNDYDIGIYNNSGNLVLDIGPTPGTTFAPAKNFHTLPWTQGSTSLSAGRYYLAFTTNCTGTCAAVAATTTYVSFAINVSGGASSGGALPSTMTPPTDKWGTGDQPTIVIQ
ncbi:MAG: hypothetical protein WCA13_00465 [Terriglobales bacterium]